MKKHIQSAALKAAFPMTIPVMAGYIFLGISYGVLSRTNGFPIWLPVVTALIIYTGSMEFLLVSILASAFHPMAAFVTALVMYMRRDHRQVASALIIAVKAVGIVYMNRVSGVPFPRLRLIAAVEDVSNTVQTFGSRGYTGRKKAGQSRQAAQCPDHSSVLEPSPCHFLLLSAFRTG